MIVSMAGGGGGLHQDPHGECFWNAHVIGRKRWTLVASEELRRLRGLPGKAGRDVRQWTSEGYDASR